MEINLQAISFHDSVIHKVIEDINTSDITYEIEFLVDWDKNIFENRKLIFRDTLNYEIKEIPFGSTKQILDIKELYEIKMNNIIRKYLIIETNAGDRYLYCTKIELIK